MLEHVEAPMPIGTHTCERHIHRGFGTVCLFGTIGQEDERGGVTQEVCQRIFFLEGITPSNSAAMARCPGGGEGAVAARDGAVVLTSWEWYPYLGEGVRSGEGAT